VTSTLEIRSRARLAGAVAAGMALGVGELVSAFADPRQSLVGSVGNEIVDRSAGGLVRWAIEWFGTADKAVLVIGIVVVCLLLGAWLGRLTLDRAWVGPVGFGFFGLAGLVCGLRDPLTSGVVVVAAAILAALAGIATLWFLLRVARLGRAVPKAATVAVATPGDDKASRRAFFAWSGAAGAFAATLALGSRSLGRRTAVEASRESVVLPPVSRTDAAAIESELAVDGLTPYLVPSDRFYRIDTALLVPQVDARSWRLSVDGLVEQPFEITFDELLAMSTVEEAVTLSCVSNEVGGSLVGNARWQGVPLRQLLDRAGVQPGATQVVGKSVDGFTAGFPTEAAYDGRVALVAVGMNGEPLPVNHGFPARLVVAGLYGYVSATKWLREIRLTRLEDFDGYWIPRGWAKQAPVKTQSRIDVPRAGNAIPPGRTAVAGVAWAPTRGIARVEVQIDDGPWEQARLGDVVSKNTWVQWLYEWDAPPGRHTITVRATDGTGETQTSDVRPPAPDGATGWPTRRVTVEGA
jgi:DMSO/TMAO reductase YedYZ molybdopterin-dependent catalytic subunit